MIPMIASNGKNGKVVPGFFYLLLCFMYVFTVIFVMMTIMRFITTAKKVMFLVAMVNSLLIRRITRKVMDKLLLHFYQRCVLAYFTLYSILAMILIQEFFR